MPSPIVTHETIVEAVAAERLIDAEHNTDRAISVVAARYHLDPAAVALIAAEATRDTARAEAFGALEHARAAHGNTDAAIKAASAATELPVDVLCQLAAEEADPQPFEGAGALADVAARSMGITVDVADAQPGCRGCGACTCGSAASAYEAFAAEDVSC